MTATTAPRRINGVPAGDAAPAGEAASGAPAWPGALAGHGPGSEPAPTAPAPQDASPVSSAAAASSRAPCALHDRAARAGDAAPATTSSPTTTVTTASRPRRVCPQRRHATLSDAARPGEVAGYRDCPARWLSWPIREQFGADEAAADGQALARPSFDTKPVRSHAARGPVYCWRPGGAGTLWPTRGRSPPTSGARDSGGASWWPPPGAAAPTRPRPPPAGGNCHGSRGAYPRYARSLAR